MAVRALAAPWSVFGNTAGMGSGGPWRIAYDAKSGAKPPNCLRASMLALMRAWTLDIKAPHGVVSTKVNAASLECEGALRRHCEKGKRFFSLFRCGSNRFEDRATSWRRDTAHRRICDHDMCVRREARRGDFLGAYNAKSSRARLPYAAKS
eukprot:6324511-Prymnesium_polylepis.1